MNFSIKPDDKILILAVKPEDVAIACGGLVSKYYNQVDILVLNVNGLEYEGKIFPIPQTSDLIYSGFLKIAEKSGINKLFMRTLTQYEEDNNKTAEERLEIYQRMLNLKEYNIIFVPQKNEQNPIYRYVGNEVLKALLGKYGYNSNLKILRYELFFPIKDANFYEDITGVVEEKKELISSYIIGEGKEYINNVLNLNKFRTFTSYLSGKAEYVEAYYIDDTNAFMQIPDRINKDTDKDYENEEIKSLFEGQNIQVKLQKAKREFKEREIVLYGAGDYTRYIFKNYDISNLNIKGICDERFAEDRTHEFYGLKCLKPEDLKNANYDLILISNQDFVKEYHIVSKILKGTKNESVEIRPLIKTELSDFMPGVSENRVCARPFHVLSVTPGGFCITCCPAYIRNYTIGRLSSGNFDDIWNSTNAKNLRRALINGDYCFCDLNTCIQMELIDKTYILKYRTNKNTVKSPDTIYMGWDYDCNVACITCRNNLIKNNESTLRALQSIEQGVLDACKGAKLFYASGNGDPFGSSYASGLIKKVAEINPDIKFFIHTNGVLCTKKRCEELGIIDRISNVIFSIHASKKETYDKIVRYGNFDKVMENIEWIAKRKQKNQIQSFTLAFVVHKLNYKDMPDFVRIAEKYNIQASFRYYRQWANNTEYNYNDMAVFEKWHPEYPELVSVLQNDVFDSPNCNLDPNLRTIREKGM